jgi:CubicO group peptidase (beta-lactamase class C family)
MLRKRTKLLTVILITATLFTYLDHSRTALEAQTLWPTEGWETSSLRKQGMDSTLIDRGVKFVENNGIGLVSMLIVRNGYLVKEHYFGPNKEDVFHPLYSVTKSITATVMGIAIDKGFIEGVHLKVLDFFPERNFTYVDEDKLNMTIYHLLTMTSGLQWNEHSVSYSSPLNDLTIMKTKNDWVQYTLDKPMVSEPGTQFSYNTGVSHLLSAIIQVATNMTTQEFADEHLFSSLGITNYEWFSDPQGITKGGIDIFLTARDMLKIGYLYHHNGTWDGDLIISEEWIQEASKKQIYAAGYSSDYGYQWWIRRPTSIPVYFANGWAGQRIYVASKKNLIVAFTSYDSTGLVDSVYVNYILPAATEDYSNPWIWVSILVPTGSVIAIGALVTTVIFIRKKKLIS